MACYDRLINFVSDVYSKQKISLWVDLCVFVIANLVLQDCIEREFVGNEYAEKRRGLFVVRGENVVFIAQLVRVRAVVLSVHFDLTVVAQDSNKPEVDAALTQIEWSTLVEKRDKLLKPLSSERADPLADD
jgi:hypothetical protein